MEPTCRVVLRFRKHLDVVGFARPAAAFQDFEGLGSFVKVERGHKFRKFWSVSPHHAVFEERKKFAALVDRSKFRERKERGKLGKVRQLGQVRKLERVPTGD
jgi:hypothetical protein